MVRILMYIFAMFEASVFGGDSSPDSEKENRSEKVHLASGPKKEPKSSGEDQKVGAYIEPAGTPETAQHSETPEEDEAPLQVDGVQARAAVASESAPTAEAAVELPEVEADPELIAEPAVEEPEVESEPVLTTEPAVEEPEIEAEPVLIAQPAVMEPEVDPEPVLIAQPAVMEPEVDPEPVLIAQPAVVEPEVDPEPALIAQPAVMEPEVDPEPALIAEPAVEEPVIQLEPIAEAVVVEPEVDPEPVLIAQPVVIEPEIEPEPVLIAQPVVAEPEPVLIAEPVVVEPVIEPEPIAEPVVVEPAPIAELEVEAEPAVAPSAEPILVSTDGGDISVMTGRTHTLEIDGAKPIANIDVLSDPEHGNVTVNPDQSLALVFSHTNETGDMSFDVRITYDDGSTEQRSIGLDVVAGAQEGGWGLGNNFYMLEVDENDNLVIETGDNHREVYVSGSEEALSVSDIALLEGIDPSKIDGKWLRDNPEYGSNPEWALDEEAGTLLWHQVSNSWDAGRTSNWLLFERGHTYDDFGNIIDYGTKGESPLHPVHITSYGEGSRPVITERINMLRADENENIVVTELELDKGLAMRDTNNLIIDSVTANGTLGAQRSEGYTIRNSDVVDVIRETPVDPDAEYWAASPNRSAGTYIGETEGVLIENTLYDHNAWSDDYRLDGSTEGGQPPSQYSHNIYVNATTTDITIRDVITMQGASYGLLLRSGGFVEDTVILDNNAGLSLLGGNDGATGGYVGQYTLFADNVLTSAGYREAHQQSGALNWGILDKSYLTTFVDSVIAHLADPNNLEEHQAKLKTVAAIQTDGNAFYDDTVVFNWHGWELASRRHSPNTNVEDLDEEVLYETTIQTFAQALTGNPDAGISELADALRAQAGPLVEGKTDAELIIDFFQAGFEITQPDTRTDAGIIRFIPNNLGDGVRWDNRLNWSSEDLPGVEHGDSVDLAGNWVTYGGITTTVTDLHFGDGGRLEVSSGRLNTDGDVTTGEDGALITTTGSGQMWVNGIDTQADVTISVEGGRFANTGTIEDGVSVQIQDGQAILATGGAEFTVGANEELRIVGDEAKVGFDGTDGDIALLKLSDDSVVVFDAEDGEGLGQISEFRSGAFGDDSDVQSGIVLDGTLALDLTGYSPDSGDYVLMNADALTGQFDAVKLHGLTTDRDALIITNYTTDQVILRLFDAGSGTGFARHQTFGTDDGTDETAELWDALAGHQGAGNDGEPPVQLFTTELNGFDL